MQESSNFSRNGHSKCLLVVVMQVIRIFITLLRNIKKSTNQSKNESK